MHSPRLNRSALLLTIYLCYVGALTLAPFDFSTAPLVHQSFAVGDPRSADMAFNILGYIPFGAILYHIVWPVAEKFLFTWGLTVGSAAVVSLGIEIGQLFLPERFPSYSDLMANTLGGGLGFWCAYYLTQKPWVTLMTRYRHILALLILTGYLGSVTGIFIWAALPQRLETWDPDYLLLIGNETSLNRPWMGKIYCIALYDRALTAAEVLAQFQAGPYVEPEVLAQGRPVALYTFREGGGRHVHDWSPLKPPLDLEVAEPQNTVWLASGGLELTQPTVLRSAQRPEKIYQRFTATHTFSVAAWLEPKDALPRGPGRIVSYSLTTPLRNFTLGQEASEIHFRVRTRVAGPDGTRMYFRSNNLGLKPMPTHLVAVYAWGVERLYVNGDLFPGSVTRDGLTFFAQTFDFNAASHWQRGLVVVLLLGPIGGALWTLRPRLREC
jgi:VanZ family protein